MGLIIPHIVRMLVGSDHRRVLVISTIVGSIFLIWCDVIARMVLGNEELPIGNQGIQARIRPAFQRHS